MVKTKNLDFVGGRLDEVGVRSEKGRESGIMSCHINQERKGLNSKKAPNCSNGGQRAVH